VAATTRGDGSDKTLSDVKKQLVDLNKKCQLPSQLEQEIFWFVSQVTTVGSELELSMGALSEPTRKAIKSKYRKLVRAVDAFRDYVQHRSGREDHIHVMGRAEVGEFVQDSLEDLVEYLDKF